MAPLLVIRNRYLFAGLLQVGCHQGMLFRRMCYMMKKLSRSDSDISNPPARSGIVSNYPGSPYLTWGYPDTSQAG